MKILQLGNGTALDYNSVSPSFLIDLTGEEDYLLFDCGYNVVKTLYDKNIDISKINHVFISHTHEDHIANLMQFIYLRIFEYQKFTKIFVGNKDTYNILYDLFLKNLKVLLSSNVESFFNSSYIGLIEINDFKRLYFTVNEPYENFKVYIGMQILKTNHQILESSGLIIFDEYSEDKIALCITGDTKAYSFIEKQIESFFKEKYPDKIVIFHDYSKFNKPSRNPHACDNDIESEYSEKFRNSLNYYHHGDNFYKDWINLNEVEKNGILKIFEKNSLHS
jgi:hypothetical protein